MSKKVVDVKATNHNIVVELLEADEVFNTRLEISKDSKLEAPQAYVIDIGPSVVRENVGVQVGDRVVFSGMMTPLPRNDHTGRRRGLIEAHAIKAVLKEESALLL